MIREAERRKLTSSSATSPTAKQTPTTTTTTIIEPTSTACNNWADRVAGHAHKLSTMAGCTPSYFNAEGEADRQSPQEQAETARAKAIWGQGYLDYEEVLREWRGRGALEGLEVS